MSDDEYDEELPPICVNSSTSSASALWMPSAEELASERAREAECERELLTLRAQHESAGSALTDSSGSEGEAALAAAVSALAMPAGDGTKPADSSAPLPALLARLAPDAPALMRASSDVLQALTDDICMAVGKSRIQSEQEAVLAAAWLCACAAGQGGGRGAARRARRALHRLLDSHVFESISEESFQTLSEALLDMPSSPQMRLEMADVLTCTPYDPAGSGQAGPGPGQGQEGGYRTRLATALLWATVSATLGVSVPKNTSGSACACALSNASAAAGAGAAGAAGAVGARAAGRLARRCSSPARCAAAAAAAIAPAAARASTAAPHRLEMLVNASKLQLLFRE